MSQFEKTDEDKGKAPKVYVNFYYLLLQGISANRRAFSEMALKELEV